MEHDPLWVKDGNIYTCAGISAGIDLALAWVEEDCGAALAHEAARELVLFLRRPGGQLQVSVSLAAQASEMASIRELQIWIAEHLRARLSVEDLAERMAMSVRNFERVFTREVGTTPSQYVLQTRVEAARRQLERTGDGLKQVAAAAWFGSVVMMRRAFLRLLGITPGHYRELAEELRWRAAGSTRRIAESFARCLSRGQRGEDGHAASSENWPYTAALSRGGGDCSSRLAWQGGDHARRPPRTRRP